MDAVHFATLKQKLLEAKDLSEITEYFFEHFGSVAFAVTGEPMEDTRFLQAFGQVVIRTLGVQQGTLTGTPRRIGEHRMIHGGFALGEWEMMMFYFEDIAQGFVAIGDARGPERFARFSLIEPPVGPPS